MNMNLDNVELEELNEYASAFDMLKEYCERKENAIIARKAGNIEAALKFEAQLEIIYENLPEEFRW